MECQKQEGFVAKRRANHLRQPRGAFPFFRDGAHSPAFSTFTYLCILLHPGVLVRALAKCTCSADGCGRTTTKRTVSYIREVAERSQCRVVECVYGACDKRDEERGVIQRGERSE